ncbi:DedA family protein [Nonomuraea sp. NBC_01738]|uniref:DedA family protein n=1 Tax=Nonomuraea sp. NBC_01738 TaxID=2976003 RepID=UPI002E16738E
MRHGRLGRRIGEERWGKAEEVFARSGWALSLAYFLPVVHALTPAVAGVVGVPYRRFMPWAVLGGTAWVSTYVVLGAVAGGVVRAHAGLLLPAGAVVVIALLAITTVVRRTLRAGRSGSPAERSASRPPR